MGSNLKSRTTDGPATFDQSNAGLAACLRKLTDGWPALVNAGGAGHTAVAEALLTARANIDSVNNVSCYASRQTALDYARENNNPVTVKLLEEAAKVTAACAALT
eukprot:g63609.t1